MQACLILPTFGEIIIKLNGKHAFIYLQNFRIYQLALYISHGVDNIDCTVCQRPNLSEET